MTLLRKISRLLLVAIGLLLIEVKQVPASVVTEPESNVSNLMFGRNCIKINDDSKKIVCICNDQFCDELVFDWPKEAGHALQVTSTRAGARFHITKLETTTTETHYYYDDSTTNIQIDLSQEHQTILGWGGAFTDAATINIESLSRSVSDKLLQSYFGANGLEYNFGRVPIGGTDFSTRVYSYDDNNQPTQSDFNLTNWCLADEDIKYKIPVIKRALDIVRNNGNTIKLFATPWSPPRWMKTSKNFNRGHLIDREEIYQAYANYLIKFYQAYKSYGIEFWGATVQNEPISAYLPFYWFNSLQMSTSETIKFVGKYLGPALVKNGYTKDNFKLMVGDDSLGFVDRQVPGVMEDGEVQKYVSGLAFHWYTSGSVVSYDSLSRLVDKLGDKIDFVIMSEACTGSMIGAKHVDLGNWQRAEMYATDIIEDFERATSAWIDWNLALDERGGPNWAKNFVDSPIIVNPIKDEFYKQPMYYALAHFSKFFKPQSVRIQVELDNESTRQSSRDLMIIAAHIKTTGHVVVNILNKAQNSKQLQLRITGTNYTLDTINIEPKSINSVILKL